MLGTLVFSNVGNRQKKIKGIKSKDDKILYCPFELPSITFPGVGLVSKILLVSSWLNKHSFSDWSWNSTEKDSYDQSSHLWSLQHSHSDVINRHIVLMVAMSRGHMITIYDLSSWLPASNVGVSWIYLPKVRVIHITTTMVCLTTVVKKMVKLGLTP